MIDIFSHLIATVNTNCQATAGFAPVCPGQLPQAAASQGQIQTILGFVFGIIGSLALLMIVASGLRYILAAGDPQKTKQAKEGVIYALIGLAVAVTAEAIVTFVGTKV